MKRYSYGFIMSISLLCLWMIGCAVSGENPVLSTVETKATPSATALSPTQAATASSTKTPRPFTPSPVPLVLPAVTMSPQAAQAALQELLKTNGNCTGKCIAGIRPDEMTLQEAVNEMARWGMLTMYKDSLGKIYINNLKQDSQGKQVDANLSIGNWKEKFETIDTVSFYIPSHEYGGLLGEDVWLANREAWQAFRLNNLLKTYGIPSYVGFSFETNVLEGRPMHYGVEIQYRKINLVVSIGALTYTDGENIHLCPSKDPHTLGVQINPEEPLGSGQDANPVTWQALIGTDLDAFYRKFTNETNPDTCVTTTFEQIGTLQPGFH